MQTAAGMFAMLPLGKRVLDKICSLVSKELDGSEILNAQQAAMPSLVPAELWKKTERWESAGSELFRIADRKKREFCLGATHEEVFTDIVASAVRSHRDLPLFLYQIGQKYRDEARPRYGLMRGREFIMKDAYSFHVDDDDFASTYEEVNAVYSRIFDALGFDYVRVEADGGDIGDGHSHEFHVLSNLGEDTLVHCDKGNYSANVEIAAKRNGDACTAPGCSCGGSGTLIERKGIEVGHIFHLGQKYSAALGATFQSSDGARVPVTMGCYGIGITRILAAAIEAGCESGGCDAFAWPASIAPYSVLLLPSKSAAPLLRDVYERLPSNVSTSVVFEDRTDVSRKKQAAEIPLVGYPVVVTCREEGAFTISDRAAGAEWTVSSAEECASFLEKNILEHENKQE